MYAVERLGSYITRGVYTVSGPFHPFGGAVDIIVVEQEDGSFKTSPWYVRFGKFQGVLKTKEKVVNINVNGVDADFHMYLDHKGEAYFLKEVEVEEGESVLYQSTSGEDTDVQSNERRPVKSKSCNYDAQIDVNNGQTVARTGSRRARLLGVVFGRKSNSFREEEGDPDMVRASSLERAEFAANLLEVKWSTNLATSRKASARKTEYDEQKNLSGNENELAELRAHAEILHKTIEDLSEVNSLPVCGVVVAKESSNNVDDLRDVDNEKIIESEVRSMNSVRHNSNESPSSVDIHLIASNSVETEVLGVILHDTIMKRNADDVNTETVVWEVPGGHSRRTSSCTSCGLDNDDKTELILGSVEEAKLHSIGTVSGCSNLAHQVEEENKVTYDNDGGEIHLCRGLNISPSESSEEEQFLFSDLDDLKLSEAQCTESISPNHVEKVVFPSLTLVGTEPVNESPSIYNEPCSSSDKCVQENLPNGVEDLVEKPRQMSCPIDILGRLEVDGERVGRMVESLPDLLFHGDDLGAHDLHHSYHSLDLDTKSSKWALLRKNVSNYIKSDAEEKHQLAEGQLTTGDNQISGQLINVPFNPAVGDLSKTIVASSGSWRMWPFSLKRSRTLIAVQPGLNGTESSDVKDGPESTTGMGSDKTELKSKTTKKKVRLITPTSEQLASLNLKEGRNTVTFTFSTAMLGNQQVDARIYLWKWNTRIVISDVDGTITKSDVLGQFMPWVGVDWSHTGVAHLFSAIKENGYQLLFLSARAISQACITRQFLVNLKQDGKVLPDGPVVISPDGLFPSLFREVIRRAPHEFKIACLEDIKALFPSDCSPFYAGFGNRDTDEISYRKVGIPKGKIFIINPKGEVAVNRRVDTKSYPSLQALVQDMFPPMSSTEQEDFNSWNYWKLPPLLDG